MTGLVQDFVETVNKVGGIHENGLLANAYLLVPGDILHSFEWIGPRAPGRWSYCGNS